MSIFNQNMIEESGDWAVEQLYDKGPWICPVCKQPGSLYRKLDSKEYSTVYSLFGQYRYICEQKDRLVDMITKYVPSFEPRKHDRKMFIQFVREHCKDKIIYKNNYYYSVTWFNENILKNLDDYYFAI